MIHKFLNKVPAGMMIVPMFLSAIINTFFPDLLQIGSFTTAIFTSAGATAIMGVQLVCMGAQLRVKELAQVARRGGVLLLSKYAIGAVIGVVIGKVFGMGGFLGLTTLAVISAITNSNGSMYLALNVEYGDEIDQTAMSFLAINDGPFLTLITLGASGLATIPVSSLIAVIIPIAFGMLIGNLDNKMSKFLEPGVGLLLPFVGITLGAGINIKGIIGGGAPGILLGLITVFISGPFVVFFDRILNKRPGYAGWAVSSTAGNAIAVPAVVATIDSAWAPYVAAATTQVAASTVLTAILIPIMTAWWAKKYGCPKYPLPGQDFSKKDWKAKA
ncbi:2-keto-3-deoxygluconate permease [Peptoniphilus sp. GNH]|nr:putative 2-keto-3-deoxygluconate transporter [Clostridiales bacterium KA00134]UHR03220.1 2-keto-3-deoxygluconate permease [Peptoniphilus sp. GNH]